MNDWQLLNEYATRNSEEAFRTLVDRYAGLVYHAALQRIGRPHLAEEITQAVFIVLARKAGRIPRRTVLSGWLFQATRFAVLNLSRQEARRQHYEQEALMNDPRLQADDGESTWKQIEPSLYDALDQLSKKDREAVLIRFFQGGSNKEVGLALGVNETAARTRVSRAVEKLRSIFARQGLVIPSASLVLALACFGKQAPLAGMTASISALAAAKGAAGSTSILLTAKGILKLMAWTKFKTALAAGAVTLLVAGVAIKQRAAYRFSHQLVSIHARNAPLAEVIHKIERQTGQKICWDETLNAPVTLDVSSEPLPRVLDQLIVQEGAYWGTDYAVYSSKDQLENLTSALQRGSRLQDAGWTNLSGRRMDFAYTTKLYFPDGTYVYDRSSSIGRPREGYGFVRMTFDVKMKSANAWSPEGQQEKGALSYQLGRAALSAMSAADGALAPERLLAESALAQKMSVAIPLPATPEQAAGIAKDANASWTTIYTLRKSPIEGTGIKLAHLGEPMLPQPANFSEKLQQDKIQMLTLSPEQREDHDRAYAEYRKKH